MREGVAVTLLDSRVWVEAYAVEGGRVRAELHEPVREASLGTVTHVVGVEAPDLEEALHGLLADTAWFGERDEIADRLRPRLAA